MATLLQDIGTAVGAAIKTDRNRITAVEATKAPLASPALTGTPTAPTAAVGTNTTQLATTAFVLANSSGTLGDLGVTASAAELNYNAGVTSAVQTQLNAKLATTGTAAAATKLATARTIGGVSFDGTAAINLPGVNATGNQATTGNAATATTLQTARTINGVSFNGSANITVVDSTKAPLASPALTGTPTAPTAAVGTNTTQVATTAFVQANSSKTLGDLGVTASAAELNYSAGVTSAVQTQLNAKLASTGTAAAATKLATARTIGGVSFDGTAAINLPGVNATGNQATTGNAATATTLQTARTINGVSFNGSANITLGSNSFGTRTVSTAAPSGGVDNDIWLKY